MATTMAEKDIGEIAQRLTDVEVEELLRKAYYSLDSNMHEHALKLKEIHG